MTTTNSGSSALLAAVLLALAPLTVQGQQSLPRPIVLYRPPAPAMSAPRGPATITTPAAQTKTIQPAGSRPATGVDARSTTSQGNQSSANQANADPPRTPEEAQRLADEKEWAEQQKRPTQQMLLNPSAPWNLSHAGISSGQQFAPNTYLGQKFDTWTNQQPLSQMPGAVGEMSRFQPGPFGGYTAPNMSLGSEFFSWSNLSLGGISPGATGSWDYSIWSR